MRQNVLVISLVVAAIASFLGASVASADFTVSGQWYENRGPTVNIPIGRFDGPCPPATNVVIPFSVPGGHPLAANPAGDPLATPIVAAVTAPCVRHQDPGIPMFAVPPKALAVVPQSGIPAFIQNAVSAKTTATVQVAGASFKVPANAFALNGFSQAPVPANPVVQQLDTSFIFLGPAASRAPTPNSAGGQNAAILGQSRLMQPNAWSGLGQPSRLNSNFNFTQNDGVGGPLGITRRVTYTKGANGFGGTMGMMLNGIGAVYVVADLVTAAPGNEVLVSPLGNSVNPLITVHQGRGYNTTQMRVGNNGQINLNYNIPVTCTVAIPPGPAGCGLITGISNQVFSLPAATTLNIGFPWTTGHVSAYAKGLIQGIPQTSTLTAQGSDTVSGGVRTIQLVAGGVALRNSPASGLGRTPHVDVITINLPEPGSTMALVGALGLIGGLYGARRRLFSSEKAEQKA